MQNMNMCILLLEKLYVLEILIYVSNNDLKNDEEWLTTISLGTCYLNNLQNVREVIGLLCTPIPKLFTAATLME